MQKSHVADDAIARLLDKPISAEELRAATERVAQPLVQADKDVAQILIFEAGGETMACELEEIDQVTHAARVHRIPHRSNKIVRGLCNLDGELVLCADLEKLLELGGPTAANDETQARMILMGPADNRWVVRVSAVRGVTTVPRQGFGRPPVTVHSALARYTKALAPVGQQMIALLDVARIVSGFQAALR